jgi:hypothetical protein
MQNKPNLVRRRRIANERKYLLYKGLSNFYPAGGAKKQTQFKPNSNPVLSAVEWANLETTRLNMGAHNPIVN